MHHHTPPTILEAEPVKPGRSRRKKILFGIVSLTVAILTVVAFNITSTETQGVSPYRNWSADAIIQGGAITKSELVSKYDANVSGVKGIFDHYGISRNDLTEKTSTIEYGTVHRNGDVTVGGKVVAKNAYSVSRKPFNDAHGNRPNKVTIDGTTLYEGPNMSIFIQSVDAYVFFRDGVFYRAVISSCANPVMAVATEKPKPKAPTPAPKPAPKPAPTPAPKPAPKPSYRCENLTASKINRTNHRFTATAAAQNGAEIISYSYDFGDGTKVPNTNRIVEHEYQSPGTYDVNVTVNVRAGGENIAVVNPNCAVTINVDKPPKIPAYACDSLTARAILSLDRTYSYDLVYTAESGAELTSVTYKFGDGNEKTFKAEDATGVEHTYAEPGEYTTTATLYFNVTHEGKVTERSVECEEVVNVPKPEMCPLPGKEDLPKNSPECADMPAELPQTGPMAWIGGGLGLSALVAAFYYWQASRNNLRDVMLRK